MQYYLDEPVIKVNKQHVWIHWNISEIFQLNADIRASPKPRVTWKHNNRTIKQNNNYQYYNNDNIYILNVSIFMYILLNINGFINFAK